MPKSGEEFLGFIWTMYPNRINNEIKLMISAHGYITLNGIFYICSRNSIDYMWFADCYNNWDGVTDADNIKLIRSVNDFGQYLVYVDMSRSVFIDTNGEIVKY